MKLLLAIAAAVLLILGAYVRREHQEPPPLPIPEHVIPIGTNAVPVGTHLWNTVQGAYLGEVRAVDPAHRFPDGTIRPALLLGPGEPHWIPRDRAAHLVTAAE